MSGTGTAADSFELQLTPDYLASHTRLLLYNRPKYTLLFRWGALYPLYVLAEIAIVATDLAELLGSAIALCLLFPRLELWHGVLITAFDVILILGMGDPLRGKRVKSFEILIGGLVIAVMVCMLIVIARVDVDWRTAFEGYLPSKFIFKAGGLYTSVGILGATVMPHSLYIGSALATQDRVSFRSEETLDIPTPSGHPFRTVSTKASEDSLPHAPKLLRSRTSIFTSAVRTFYAELKESAVDSFRKPPANVYSTAATSHKDRQNNPDEFVKAHLYHGTIDVVGSLLGFAVVINSVILMLAAAVFFYGQGFSTIGEAQGPASLFDAYDLIRDFVGQAAATLFAIALLAAGQSSSLIATVAGQAVCEGFLQWRVSPVVRRVLTRLIAIVPSMAVAIALGRDGINTLLVISQVVLSIVLPFVTFPLLFCTASRQIMSVRKAAVLPDDDLDITNTRTAVDLGAVDLSEVKEETRGAAAYSPTRTDLAKVETASAGEGEIVDYSNNKLTIAIGAAIWLIVVSANMYVIVELGLGNRLRHRHRRHTVLSSILLLHLSSHPSPSSRHTKRSEAGIAMKPPARTARAAADARPTAHHTLPFSSSKSLVDALELEIHQGTLITARSVFLHFPTLLPSFLSSSMMKGPKSSGRPLSKANGSKNTTTKMPSLPSIRKGKGKAQSRTEANVAGYEARQARKAQTQAASADLYEHVQEKGGRRARVGLDLDRDEAMEYGVGTDGGGAWESGGLDGVGEGEREALRARLLGEHEDDEQVASGDDEELDSDAAFEESDEERFAGFFSSKKSKAKSAKKAGAKKAAVRFADVNLDEDEDMESDSHEKRKAGDVSSEEELDSEEEGEDDEFIDLLDRKAPEEDDAGKSEPRKRRTVAKERTEAGDENEFRALSSGTKLNLDDILAPLAAQSSTLQSLKKSTKVLGPSASAKAKALSAPLPQRIQERLDRQAAYEQTKEEVDKWTDTMKRIREAEHLSFPLQAQSNGRASNLELSAKFKPTTELESAVDTLLKSANMREQDIPHTEDRMLEMNKLSVEEVAQRRAELRKMRELMFRAEIKARRVGKIKSKTYRKLRRKEKERLGEKIDEDVEDDGDGEAGKMKAELDRARERATLRHKHTGKWARQMRQKEGMDAESRRDIEDMLARGEKLRRRIKGVGSDESEGDDDSEEDSDDGMDMDGDVEKIKQGAFEELRRLDEDDEGADAEQDAKNKAKSVFEMKFMKDAMARRNLEANQEKDDFIREMGGAPEGADDSDNDEEEGQEVDPSSGVVAHRAGGRIVFRPGAPINPAKKPMAPPASDTSSVTLRSTDLLSPPQSPRQNKRSRLSSAILPDTSSNPWLNHEAATKVKVAKKVNEVVVDKDSKLLDKSKHKLKKMSQKKDDARDNAQDDAAVEISLDATLASTSKAAAIQPGLSAKAKTKAAPAPASTPSAQVADHNSDSESDDDNVEITAQELALNAKGKGKAVNGVKAFEQRDLVALAFAGDNVVQTFEEAKQREIAADAPREVDTTIPGWGSWAGTGVKKAAPKASRIKKIAGIDPTTRADYNKKNIIISERRDKKASKYLVKDLPYPYTSKVQFERAMEQPVGVEWNTRVAFQRATLPKVVKKRSHEHYIREDCYLLYDLKRLA
ncbi:hypothetical protein D9619_002453 [Psilocybe cf. subviscida]|uniref:U3 small nucleolar RNA-associated protein 14 n=1 Tax=Psilocybe cf. subviscida TaxID=2480587 RepID=A0A8H5AXT8_9AGAR|nr:hypothetical protein D9619_002453 [Psilocybe cf. subviscida]